MLKIRRLNLDSSWHLQWAGQSLLIDPWLLGVETDYAPWFNQQWHVNPPIAIPDLPDYHSVLVSQHFSDHCHEETLLQLKATPILSTPSGAKRIQKTIKDREIQVLPSLTNKRWLSLGALAICRLAAPRQLKASFTGIAIRHQEELLLYCPHGYQISKEQQNLLSPYKTLLLITTLSTFQLPFFLGGAVNPGLKAAKKLVLQTAPKYLLATHDEEKHAKGIVKKLARTSFPKHQHLKEAFPDQYLELNETKSILSLDY